MSVPETMAEDWEAENNFYSFVLGTKVYYELKPIFTGSSDKS